MNGWGLSAGSVIHLLNGACRTLLYIFIKYLITTGQCQGQYLAELGTADGTPLVQAVRLPAHIHSHTVGRNFVHLYCWISAVVIAGGAVPVAFARTGDGAAAAVVLVVTVFQLVLVTAVTADTSSSASGDCGYC